jgi:sporulation protein YlmC with PRC-barrel domain
LVTARRVLGETVFSASGGKIGKIEDLMIDKSSGRTLYALMAFDGFLGIGTQYYPVPWSMLDYNTAVNAYVVPLTPAQVENAHSVSDAEVEHEIEWREKIHEFYGATPYWPGALV